MEPIRIGRREAIIGMGTVVLSTILVPKFFQILFKQIPPPFLSEKYPALIISVGDGAGNILNQVLENNRHIFRSVSIHASPDGYQKSLSDLRILVNSRRRHDPELGKQACEQEKARIVRILSQSEKTIIIACLGGGLGTGAGPLIASWSKEMGAAPQAIVTYPFFFESKTCNDAAERGLGEFQRQTKSTYYSEQNID